MDVVLQPPSSVRPGEAITTPLIVSLKNMQLHGAHSSSGRFLVWAFASIVSDSSEQAVGSISNHPGLLSGSLVDSPHEARLDEGNVFEYVRFPQLVINQVGNYRIQVSLLRMPQVDIRGAPGRVENVGIVRTRSICVDPLASPSCPGKRPLHIGEITHLIFSGPEVSRRLKELRNIGVVDEC